jgi:hypothetical protein
MPRIPATLSRRACLRAAGTMLGLPVLESLAGMASAAAMDAPVTARSGSFSWASASA